MEKTLTQLETALLANLADSGFEGPEYWSDCLTGGLITNKNVAGVVSSLCKKGILYANFDGADSTVTLLK